MTAFHSYGARLPFRKCRLRRASFAVVNRRRWCSRANSATVKGWLCIQETPKVMARAEAHQKGFDPIRGMAKGQRTPRDVRITGTGIAMSLLGFIPFTVTPPLRRSYGNAYSRLVRGSSKRIMSACAFRAIPPCGSTHMLQTLPPLERRCLHSFRGRLAR